MSDLISREDTIDDLHTANIPDEWMAWTENFINAQPLVEPERCGDCINREALLRKLQKVSTEAWKMKLKCNAETVWNQCIDYVKDAPSVEPERKTGKWIKAIDPDVNAWTGGHTCSECGRACVQMSMNYCANCGAKMKGEHT